MSKVDVEGDIAAVVAFILTDLQKEQDINVFRDTVSPKAKLKRVCPHHEKPLGRCSNTLNDLCLHFPWQAICHLSVRTYGLQNTVILFYTLTSL